MSDENKKVKLDLSRPADKSLEAFKEWAIAFTKRINPNAKDTMTEEQWVKAHQEFWAPPTDRS